MDTDSALKEAITQVAQAKVAEALGGDILGKLIKGVMEHRNSGYGRDSKTEFENIVNRLIYAQIEEAVRDHLKQHSDALKTAVAGAMSGHIDKMATSVVDAFVNEDWRARLEITVERKEA